MAGLEPIASSVDRSAFRMPHHYDEPGTDLCASELQTTENLLADNIAGDARIQQFSESLVENSLDRDARIDATQHDGEWFLGIAGRLPFSFRIAMVRLTILESLVPFDKPIECLCGSRGDVLFRAWHGERNRILAGRIHCLRGSFPHRFYP